MKRRDGIQLEVRHVSIPFRFTYGHSKATHRGVDSIICIARDGEGFCGYGEAVPRTYVTGETCESVMQDIVKFVANIFAHCATAESVRQVMIEAAERWEGAFPSCAFCAIELAMLDLIARQQGVPFCSMIAEPQTAVLNYSASIGLGVSAFVKAQLLAYRAMGFKSFKLKVGGANDAEALKRMRNILGYDVQVFVDANGAWDRETAAHKLEQFHAAGVWGVEEPLRRRAAVQQGARFDCEETLDERHFKDNAWLRSRSPVKLIADESVISLRSMHSAMEFEAFDVVDIRLSKLGGVMLSSHIVDLARGRGMDFYIGAMVGETSTLATAGAHFGAVHSDHLCIQGHSHKALHGLSYFAGGSQVKRNGKLILPDDSGLGVTARSKRLDRVTVKKEVIQL